MHLVFIAGNTVTDTMPPRVDVVGEELDAELVLGETLWVSVPVLVV